MTRLINHKICPEDELGIVLDAENIPDQATVAKLGGTKRYVLRHRLTLYSNPAEGAQPVTIDGIYIVDDLGNISSAARLRLVWMVNAEDLVQIIRNSWKDDK